MCIRTDGVACSESEYFCRQSKARRRFLGQLNLPFFHINLQVLAVTEGYTVSRTLSAILEDLENVTATYSTPSPEEESRSMFEKDLAASVDALTRLIKHNAANKTRPLSNKHDISNLVKTSSNLLELSNLPAWKKALKVMVQLNFICRDQVSSRDRHQTCRLAEQSAKERDYCFAISKLRKTSARSYTMPNTHCM